jgi:DNA-binding NtrC family response regulator
VADDTTPRDGRPQDDLAAELAGRRVLVVDDDNQVRALLARQLQAYGVVVDTASGGAQAMAMLDRDRFDAMMLDLDMPGITGLDVLLHVQRAAPALPVLVVTGTFEAERIEGAAEVLSKPVEAKVLRAALARALRGAAKG